jgi:hypothetical protein
MSGGTLGAGGWSLFWGGVAGGASRSIVRNTLRGEIGTVENLEDLTTDVGQEIASVRMGALMRGLGPRGMMNLRYKNPSPVSFIGNTLSDGVKGASFSVPHSLATTMLDEDTSRGSMTNAIDQFRTNYVSNAIHGLAMGRVYGAAARRMRLLGGPDSPGLLTPEEQNAFSIRSSPSRGAVKADSTFHSRLRLNQRLTGRGYAGRDHYNANFSASPADDTEASTIATNKRNYLASQLKLPTSESLPPKAGSHPQARQARPSKRWRKKSFAAHTSVWM